MGRTRNPNGMGTYKRLKDGRVAWRQKKDGEERQVSAKTMKELQDKVKKIADLPIIKEKYTVTDWFDKWLDIYIKPLKKTATYNQYETMWRQHIKPVIGKRKLSGIKTYDIQKVIAVMNEKGLASKTMKHAKNVMSLAFAKAEFERIIAKNPVDNIEIPVKQAKPRKVLPVAELNKLFDSMANSRWIWSVKFLLATGIRRGELLALKWSDIDWKNKRISINKSYSITGLGDTKNAQSHDVPLSKLAVEILDEQKKMLKDECNPSLYIDKLKKDPLIFPSETGEMVKPNTYYHALQRFGEKVGVKVSPHMFRHTFVFLSRKNICLKDLQNILGHSESTTTLDIYGDIINDNMDENIKQLDSIFDNVEMEIQKIKLEEEKKKPDCKIIQFPNAK